MIKFSNVSIKYINDFYSLFNLNLEITKNTLFVGNTYDGAFAIFRLLSKLDKHYLGEITVDNENIKNIKQKNLDVAFVSQKNFLFNGKTALANALYPFKVRGQATEETKSKIITALNKCGIDSNAKAKTLPFGKQKLLCVVRAMMRKPKYLLLENVFDNLNNADKQILSHLISSYDGLIVASGEKIEPCYQGFETIYLDNGSIKKE